MNSTAHYYTEIGIPAGHGSGLRGHRATASRASTWKNHRHGPADPTTGTRDDARLAHVRTQLAEYFDGRRTAFDLLLDRTAGTTFQRRVWQALLDIPYGETISYGELARRIGQPAAVRAVGLANGRNPISVVVPCHRVVGTGGKLTGYGGGTERKSMLLALEARARGWELLW